MSQTQTHSLPNDLRAFQLLSRAAQHIERSATYASVHGAHAGIDQDSWEAVALLWRQISIVTADIPRAQLAR